MAFFGLIVTIIVACIIGSLTGIGGGIIIKPVLDFIGVYAVKEISLYTSLALIGMSLINMWSNRAKLRFMPWNILLSLTGGAIIGGVVGNRLLMFFLDTLGEETIVRIIQSSLLILLLSVTLYLKKREFSLELQFGILVLVCIGMVLGTMAGLLSIGGGPINVAILLLVFGFSMKVSALYSIMMILFSQLASFSTVVVSTGLNDYAPLMLIAVFVTGVIGGVIGSKVSGRLSTEMANRVFTYVFLGVISLNALNIIRVSVGL